jgi:hypothetical protein
MNRRRNGGAGLGAQLLCCMIAVLAGCHPDALAAKTAMPLKFSPKGSQTSQGVTFSTVIGGNGFDAAYGIATDSAGAFYLTGETNSGDWPSGTGQPQPYRHAYVAKINPDGSVSYCTTLAGSGEDAGRAIAVDSAGNAYAAGTTSSADFPVTAGALRTSASGPRDAFVAKLDAAGHIVYATYLGGSGSNFATAIAADAGGNAYVTGYTSSTSFPATSSAPQSTYGGGAYDAFVAKLNSTGSALIYATLLGGSGSDIGQGIALDALGDACIAGYTDSQDLPVINPLQTAQGGGDALVACLNAAGNGWNFVTYLGGGGFDEAYGIAVDASGNVYVTGATLSSDFPVTAGVFQASKSADYDAFAAKLNSGGQALAYATFIGGNGSDAGAALAVDSLGQAWVAGYTSSSDFPISNAFQSANQGGFDAFLCLLNADGTSLALATYLGGSSGDWASGVALDPAGNVTVAGYSESQDFPTLPYQSALPASFNSFVTVVDPAPAQVPGPFSPTSPPNDATDQSTSPVLTWSAAANATSYDVYFGTSSPPPFATNTTSTSYSPGTLTAGNTYYWQIFARNGAQAAPSATWSFTTQASTYSISGQVTYVGSSSGVSGVAVTLSGTQNSATATDANGSYSFSGLPAGGNYMVTPSLSGYTFTPPSQTFNNLANDQTSNFTAQPMKTAKIAKIGTYNAGQWYLDVSGTGAWAGDPPDVAGTFGMGLPGAIEVTGDWNGDGRQKMGVYYQGFWYLDFKGDGTWDGGVVDKQYNFGWSDPNVIPVVGDWNGDGRTKIGVYYQGFWYLDYDGNGIWDGGINDKAYNIGWPAPGVTPIVGDWSGTGTSKIGIYYYGFWYLDYDGDGVWNPANDKAYNFGWQATGVTPIMGDWNGDKRIKIGIYYYGFWYLDYDGNGVWDGGVNDKSYVFGWVGVTPLVGDWSGDGRTKIGVFTNGYWYLDYNGNGTWDGPTADRFYAWGQNPDTPIAAAW